MDQEDKAAYDAHVDSAQMALEQAWKLVSEWSNEAAAARMVQAWVAIAREIREASRARADG